jgi:UrcA family protein
MKRAIALVGSMLSLTSLDSRAAAPADEVYSVTVQFADLDLNRQAGLATLYRRIKGAARRVCDEQARDTFNQTYTVCVRTAVSAAVARIDRPLLSEYVAQLEGQPARTASTSVAAR